MSDMKLQAVLEMSTEGAESSLNRVGEAAGKMSGKVQAGAEKAGKAVDGIGNGAGNSADKFTKAESRISDSIKRATTNLEQLGKTAAQKLEIKIFDKGLDAAKFEPMLAKLRELELAQNRVVGSSGQFGRGLQNSSYQLQDLIVQVNGGVDATKALGQQLPQLLVGFGAAGAAIGVVAALLPNIIAAFSNSADGAKKFSDALSDFDKAVGDVGSTVKSFDMEKLYEEFNNSSSAVRAATIEQIKFQQEYIKTTQLVAGKKFGESLGGMGEYSTLDKLAGAYGSSGAEKLAKQLGVTVEVAKDLLPVLGGLKSGSEDVGLAFSKFGTTLLSGNAKAVELAQTMATLSKSERDGAAASSALSEAQAKMAKGHIVTKKEAEAAAKATKASSKATEELANLLDKINGKESGLNAEYWNELERLNAAYKSGKIPLDAYSDLVDKLTKQQPFYVRGLKEEAEALKDITDLERERAKYALDISKQTQDLIEKADAAEYENSKIGATEQQLIALTAARYDEQIALKEEKIAAIEMMEGRNAEVEAIEQQISALRRLQSAEIAKPKLREQAREWEKFSDDINRALTDALMRGFESGKSFGENFVDSLKNSLKTAALKIVVNYVTNGAGQLVGTLGNAAINGVMGTSGSNGGAGANYLGTASNLNTAYGAYNTAQIGYQYAAGTMSGANAAGTVFANATGTGLDGLLATNGAFGTAAETGWASMLGEAATGAWVLAIPAIAGAISAAGSRKAYEFDGVAIKGDYAGSNFTGSAATKWEADGGWWESGDKMKKWMPLTDNKDAIIEAFFGGGIGAAGRTGYVNPVSGEYSKASDLANLGDLRDTPSFTGVDNSALVASWDADYAAWQKANPISFSGGSEGTEWTGGERPDGVTGNVWSGVGGMLGTVSRTPVLSTDPVMLAALDNAIDAIFKATQTSFKALADQFDDTDLAGKINDFSTSINLDTKSGDIDKVLAALASDVNAKMAQAFLPSIETLRLPEEAWQAAFNRVMVEVAGTSRILDMMGVSIKETFGSDTNKAITAIDGLSKAFGGIDALSTSFSAYYANFYSQEEQRAQAMEDMGKSFAALNVSMPTTRDGFRAMVDGLDLATVGGQATFKAMLDLQGVFANLVPAAEAATAAITANAEAIADERKGLQDQLNELTDTNTQALMRQRDALDASNRALFDQINWINQARANLEAAEGNVDAALSAVGESIARERQAIETSIADRKASEDEAYNVALGTLADNFKASSDAIALQTAAYRESNSAIRSLASSLKNSVGTLAPDTDAKLRASRSDAQSVLNKALSASNAGGSLVPFADSLPDAIKALAEPSEQLYSSFEDYARDQGIANAAIADLSKNATAQQSVSDMMLASLESSADAAKINYDKQVKAMGDAHTLAIKALDAELSFGQAQLDATLASAQSQVDAMRGISNSVLSLSGALSVLASSISARNTASASVTAASGAATGSTDVSVSSQVSSLYQTMLGRSAQSAGLAYWTDMAQKSGGVANIIGWFRQAAVDNGEVPKFARGGLANQGWAMVGEEGPELVNFSQPARVYTANDTQNMMGGNNAALITEIQLLRADVAMLRSVSAATAENTKNTAKQLAYWDADGLPATTT